MTTRARNLAIAAAIPLIIACAAWWFMTGSADPNPNDEGELLLPTHISTPSASAEISPSPTVLDPGLGRFERREYAVGLHEISGLPEDVAPGTRVELWVAWDPPLTKEPNVHRLIRDVLIDDVIPPLVPEGPTAVVLSVPTDQMSDLIFGHRYGALSAVLVPT